MPTTTHEQPVTGINLRISNLLMLLAAGALFIAILLATIEINKRYHQSVTATEDYISWQQNAVLIKSGSDYLTEQVRLFVQTQNKTYADNYFEELYTVRRRDSALETFPKEKTDPETYAFLRQALLQSNELTKREIYAIKLVAVADHEDLSQFPPVVQNTQLTKHDAAMSDAEKIKFAQNIVFGAAYQDAKSLITNEITYFLNTIRQATRAKQQDASHALEDILLDQRILLAFLFCMCVLTFTMIIWLVIRPLKHYMKDIKQHKMLALTGPVEFKKLGQAYNDIYKLTQANSKVLQYKAAHDSLTGLMNRSAYESLKLALREQDTAIALLLVDVDHFKQVNDRYGHEIGDKILCRVAHQLRQSFRAKDFCVRFGGDEFAVILRDAFPHMRSSIQAKITALNHILMHPDDELPPVSLSVGVAFGIGFPDTIYNNADTALYETKEHGRCGVSFFKPSDDEENNDEI